MVHIKQIIEPQMVVGIKNILKKMSSIPSITSPEIGTLQHCLYLHHKNDEIKHKLPEFGFLNCHKYVRIVGGQSGQSFGHLAKLNLRVDAV